MNKYLITIIITIKVHFILYVQKSIPFSTILKKVYADSRLIEFCFCPGLSYRKGLSWGHTADPDETLCLPPMEMKIALSAVKTQDNKEHTYVTSIYGLVSVIELRVRAWFWW